MTQSKRKNSMAATELPRNRRGQDVSQPLTEMQRMFVHRLVHDKLNQTAAARQAGLKLARLRQGDPASLLPATVREDAGADWTQWPGRPKPFSQSTKP